MIFQTMSEILVSNI